VLANLTAIDFHDKAHRCGSILKRGTPAKLILDIPRIGAWLT
jgi:hypothetical protein